MPPSGLGRLGLWLQTRGARATSPVASSPPEGTGPLIVVHIAEGGLPAAQQVCARLTKSRRDLRLWKLKAADLSGAETDKPAMGAFLDHVRPAAILLMGADLPAALILAAGDRTVPVFAAEVRLDRRQDNWSIRARMRRDLLSQLRMVMVTDAASRETALRMGASPDRVVMTGPVTEIREPPRCNERERVAMAELLRGRHAWLAAGIPRSEEEAVLDAHRAAMRKSHQALLFLVPADPARIPALETEIEASGLLVARRDNDDEPTDEMQVMITDGPTEMGLWYRLAPVTYMGGTLSGDDQGTFHPFEPASLGSAIVHGEAVARYATQWQQLDGARAARQVSSAKELADAIAELTQPDLIANLASNAWTVSTGGAGVAMQIAKPILDVLSEVEA